MGWVSDCVEAGKLMKHITCYHMISLWFETVLPRWFLADYHKEEIRSYALSWAGERVHHVLDLFGASQQISKLSFTNMFLENCPYSSNPCKIPWKFLKNGLVYSRSDWFCMILFFNVFLIFISTRGCIIRLWRPYVSGSRQCRWASEARPTTWSWTSKTTSSLALAFFVC